MQTRQVIVVSLSLKLGIVLFCLSLLFVNRLFGQVPTYFSPTMTDAQQRQTVKTTEDRNARNDLGLTGLMFAAINGDLDLAKSLFEYGADLNLLSTKEQQTALHFATNNMRALASQNVGYYLIDVYADTRLRNTFGQTPLHLVISTDTNADRTKMVEYLVKNGSDINAQTNQGDTLLHLAVNIRNYEWVETLLRQWSQIMNLNIKNEKGLTPFEYAQQLGFGSIAELFEKEYPKVVGAVARDTNGLTGLMLAIMRGDQEAVTNLAKDKSALNLKSNDRYRNSAMHIALMYQDIDTLRTLVTQGADIAIKNARDEQPVHFLVRVWDTQKKLQAAPILLDRAMKSILAKDNRGNNLLHYIVQYNDMTLLDYIVKKDKALVQQALRVSNKALETPMALADKLNRNDMKPILQDALQNTKPATAFATPPK
jgi:ankyrin repeat protein